MEIRDQLLNLVQAQLTADGQTTEATEHDTGDHKLGDCNTHRRNRTGKAIFTHTFTPADRKQEAFDGEQLRDVYFHIDETAKQVVIVFSRTAMQGMAIALGLESEPYVIWRS